MSPAVYCIIEQTRGCIAEIEWESDIVKLDGVQTRVSKVVPKFTRADLRSDDRVMKMTLREAVRIQSALFATGQKSLRHCQIRRSSDWTLLCSECHGWIEIKFGNEFGHSSDCPTVNG